MTNIIKVIGVALAALVTPVAMAMTIASAQASPVLSDQDITFVTMLANPDHYWTHPLDGPTAPIVPANGHTQSDEVYLGHVIADDVRHGISFVDEEMALDRVYHSSLTMHAQQLVIKSAMKVYIPDFYTYFFTCGTGPVCKPPLPAGAILFHPSGGPNPGTEHVGVPPVREWPTLHAS